MIRLLRTVRRTRRRARLLREIADARKAAWHACLAGDTKSEDEAERRVTLAKHALAHLEVT